MTEIIRQGVKTKALLLSATPVNTDLSDLRNQLYFLTEGRDVIDPKAHGIGFLCPPKDSHDNWKEEIPQWIYEMWDYIVRGALDFKRKSPSWLIPQMMRLTITTYNVLNMLGEWNIARPYNFFSCPW